MSHEMIVSYQRGASLPNGRYAHRSWWNQRPNLIYGPGQGIFNRSYLPCLSSQNSHGLQQDRDVKTGLEEQARQSSFSHLPKKEPSSPWCTHTHAQSLFLKWTETLWHQNKWIASFDGFYLQSKCTSSFSIKAIKMSWLNMEAPRWFFWLSSEMAGKWPLG